MNKKQLKSLKRWKTYVHNRNVKANIEHHHYAQPKRRMRKLPEHMRVMERMTKEYIKKNTVQRSKHG